MYKNTQKCVSETRKKLKAKISGYVAGGVQKKRLSLESTKNEMWLGRRRCQPKIKVVYPEVSINNECQRLCCSSPKMKVGCVAGGVHQKCLCCRRCTPKKVTVVSPSPKSGCVAGGVHQKRKSAAVSPELSTKMKSCVNKGTNLSLTSA